MKKQLFLGLLCCAATQIFGQKVWTVDKAHSKVGFTVTHHMISEVDGTFKIYDATLTSTKEDFSDAVFELSAETASINTDFEMRDGHLKGEDFFNVAVHPKLSFKSTSFTRIIGNQYALKGDLTIKGVTLPVTLDLSMTAPVKDERAKKNSVGIKAVGKISRTAFGVGAKLPLLMVGDEVQLRLLGEFGTPF
jgi:polyisoprenoid-binding protein YceI